MKKFILFTVLFIFLASAGWGQTEFYFTGQGVYGDWDDLDNWRDAETGGTAPIRTPGNGATNDIVIINTTVWNMVIPDNLTLQDLIINTGGSLISGNSDLTVTNLIINYSGQFVFTNANITVTDTLELHGILDLHTNSSSIDFMNLKLGSGLVGIRGDNASMNGTSVQVSPDSNTTIIIFDPVIDDLGNIDAGGRSLTINVGDNENVNIGNISSSG